MLKYVLYQQALAIYWMEHGENQHDGSVDISLPVHQRIYTRVNIWIARRIHSSFGFELLKYVLVFYKPVTHCVLLQTTCKSCHSDLKIKI